MWFDCTFALVLAGSRDSCACAWPDCTHHQHAEGIPRRALGEGRPHLCGSTSRCAKGGGVTLYRCGYQSIPSLLGVVQERQSHRCSYQWIISLLRGVQPESVQGVVQHNIIATNYAQGRMCQRNGQAHILGACPRDTRECSEKGVQMCVVSSPDRV